MSDVLELRNLCKSYIKDNKELIVLKNVNYKFCKGKFYAILGQSGSGKTTLIEILGLLDTDYTGEYKIYGTNANKINNKTQAKLRNKNIGFIFQDYYLDPYLKAYENIMLPLLINNNLSHYDKKNMVIKMLNSLGLGNRINHYPRELSGGEQQRVAIARALINEPDIVLADEPTGNLDENNEIKILQKLKELSKNGKCVIMVSHNREEVEKYADIVLLIKDNSLIEVKNEK